MGLVLIKVHSRKKSMELEEEKGLERNALKRSKKS